jgi:hypothetical protein
MVGLSAAMLSFAESSEILMELAGIRVDPKTVERIAKRLGRAIAKDERSLVVAADPPANTMYLGMDDTGVPVRRTEVVDRKGKQPDGSAKTREVKLVTIWTAEGRDPKGVPVRDPGSVSYSAAVETAATKATGAELSPFAQRVEREARRRGFRRTKRQVIIGDGASWIWNIADESFPGAIQIVDLFHAKQHLSDVAKAIFGVESDLWHEWAHHRHEELDQGDLDSLLQALRIHSKTTDEARKCFDYITKNRHRMDYPRFHALGLCVSSGVVEAGCKLAIGTRLKRSGMHWSVPGANAIIALRCSKLSKRFDDYWHRQTSSTTARAA